MTDPDPAVVAKRRDGPSLDGRALGRVLSKLAAAGRMADPTIPDPCATCAYREGCMTNEMAATGLQAFNCAVGADSAEFGCHHGMRQGIPTRRCAGWLAAKAAPFDAMKAIVADLMDDLPRDGEADPVREDYDAWIAKIDPAGRLDDYQRGNLWLKRGRQLAREGGAG